MKNFQSGSGKGKKSWLVGLSVFILSVCILCYLSSPSEETWIDMHIDNRQLDQAAAMLKGNYAEHPDNIIIASRLADTLLALEEYGEAKKISTSALSVDPGNSLWKRRLAYALLGLHDPEGAARALPPEERTPDFWEKLALEYHAKSSPDKAEEALKASRKDAPDPLALWSKIAQWRAEDKNIEGEKEALETALSFDSGSIPLLARLFYNRAEAADREGVRLAAESLRKLGAFGRPELETLYRLHYADKDYGAAENVLRELAGREDAIPADSIALVSILYEQKEFASAQKLVDKLSPQIETFSADARAALQSQKQAIQQTLFNQAAARGDEAAITARLRDMMASENPLPAQEWRNAIYACLALSDFFRARENSAKNNNGRSEFWLNQARDIAARNLDLLSENSLDDSIMAADIAERARDWPTMFGAWHIVLKKDPAQIRAALGLARAALQMKNYETSWQNLLRAENTAANDEVAQKDLAYHYLDFAAALPFSFPQRDEKQRHIDEFIKKQLDKAWDAAFASFLFYKYLNAGNLPEAHGILQKLAEHGQAQKEQFLGFAEASAAACKKSGNAGKQGSGSLRDMACKSALQALALADEEAWFRLLYVFRVLEDKNVIAGILGKIERSGLSLNADSLKQLVDANSFLGNYEREFELSVQLGRMTRQLADWQDSIERFYWRGDLENALKLADEAEKMFPGNARLLGRRIQMLADKNRHAQIIKDFQARQEKYPSIAQDLTASELAVLAAACQKASLAGRAIKFYRLAHDKDHDNWAAVQALANNAAREGNSAGAVRLLREYIAKNPDNNWARLELAGLLPNGGRQYREVLASTKPDAEGRLKPENYAARALALWRGGKLQEAINLYQPLLQDKNPGTYCDYAQLLLDAKKYGEARKILADALKLFPDNGRIYQLFAALYINEKNYAAAERVLKKALRPDSRSPEILRDLAWLQQMQGKTADARKTLLEAARR